ncbi:MAG: hypothetical protein R3F55_20025 [Alphaproteobacteria bacterium]
MRGWLACVPDRDHRRCRMRIQFIFSLVLLCIPPAAAEGQQLQLPEHLRDSINTHFGDALCLGPYRVSARNPAGEGTVCYWNCHDTTMPDEASNRCVCTPPLVPAGTLADGRLYCEHPGDALSDRPELYVASGPDFFSLATTRGFGRQALPAPGYQPCTVNDRGIAFTPEPFNRDSRCVVTLLSGRGLAAGWALDALRITAVGGRVEWFTNPGRLPAILVVYGDHPDGDVQIVFDEVRLLGPQGGHWSDALAR